MVEEIQKIKLSELKTIRIVYDSGEIHEIPTANLQKYRPTGASPAVASHLSMLGQCLETLSADGAFPQVEFVIPVQR